MSGLAKIENLTDDVAELKRENSALRRMIERVEAQDKIIQDSNSQ